MIHAAEGAPSADHEYLTCPLCTGSGEIARREVLRLAGVDGVLNAVGPRLVELMNERGLSVLTKTKELVEETLRRDHAAMVAHVRQALGREHESAKVALERELEKARALSSKAHERSEKLAADFALAQKDLEQAKDELLRLRNTACKKGELGESDFVEAMRQFKHIRLGEKEGSNGDYVVSVAVDEGGTGMRVLENALLVDVKKDKAIAAGDVRKVASDARSRGIAVAVLVSTSLKSKHPVDDVSHVDGVLVVATVLEDFVSKIALLTPYLSLQARLRAEAGSTIDARQRLGELADRVVTKLRDLEGITKQTRAIVKAVTSIDSAIAKARAEIVALCADATARQPVGGETP